MKQPISPADVLAQIEGHVAEMVGRAAASLRARGGADGLDNDAIEAGIDLMLEESLAQLPEVREKVLAIFHKRDGDAW